MSFKLKFLLAILILNTVVLMECKRAGSAARGASTRGSLGLFRRNRKKTSSSSRKTHKPPEVEEDPVAMKFEPVKTQSAMKKTSVEKQKASLPPSAPAAAPGGIGFDNVNKGVPNQNRPVGWAVPGGDTMKSTNVGQAKNQPPPYSAVAPQGALPGGGYGGAPGHVGAPGYGAAPGYAGAPGYGGAPGYAGAPGYGAAPGYVGAPGYGGAPGYAAGHQGGAQMAGAGYPAPPPGYSNGQHMGPPPPYGAPPGYSSPYHPPPGYSNPGYQQPHYGGGYGGYNDGKSGGFLSNFGFGNNNRNFGMGSYAGYGMYKPKSSSFGFGSTLRNVMIGIVAWQLVKGLTHSTYSVMNHYNRPDDAPVEFALPANVITLCEGNVSTLCVPNTTPLCTSDNSIFCVATLAATVPCKDGDVSAPCVDTSSADKVESTPCIANATIEGKIDPGIANLNGKNENVVCVTTVAVPVEETNSTVPVADPATGPSQISNGTNTPVNLPVEEKPAAPPVQP